MASEGLLALEAIHVLVVAPESGTRQTVARMLAGAVAPSFQVEHAANLGAAVAAARRGHFDAYLLHGGMDSDLPAALAQLSAIGPGAPVILFGARRLRPIPDGATAAVADVLDRDELSPPLLRRALRYAVERWLIEQRLAEIAHYDELTGFANRELFRELLGRALARARRTRQGMALLLLDLDGFKTVNDTLGHQAGDRLLCLIADRIKSALRESDTVARLGGDEFAVILEGVSRGRDAGLVAQRILDKVSAPLILDGQEVFTSASIGLALDGGGREDSDNLVKNADMAMFRAKSQGRGGYAFHTADMTVAVRDRMTLENDLRRALARGEFVLVYQPQLLLGSNSVVGMEALIRWRAGDADLVPPSRFIPVAEETGLIIPLGEWVLHEACAQTVAWQEQGLPPLHIAVNLSARQFQQQALAETVRRALAETGLDPSLLELELTEGHLAENVEQGIATLHALKGMGVRIAIDDFGAGYSSLAYLKQFPVDTLKIDRSFVRDIPRDPKDCAIATTVISLAHNLGLTALAEGVETPEQLDWLRDRGCDAVQGYLLSRPLDGPAVAGWLAKRKCARRPAVAAGVAGSL